MDILAKARKLRRLQKRAATRGEAEAAARALARLIERHRLDAAAVEGDDPADAEHVEVEVLSARSIPLWKTFLLQCLADFYGVFSWRRKRGVPKRRTITLMLLGRADDIALTREMFAWLSADAVRLGRDFERQLPELAPDLCVAVTGLGGRARAGFMRRAVRSWRVGFADGIGAQLTAARAEAAAESQATTQALAVLDGRLARSTDAYGARHGGLPVMKKCTSTVQGSAYEAGHKRGEQHHLGRSLETND